MKHLNLQCIDFKKLETNLSLTEIASLIDKYCLSKCFEPRSLNKCQSNAALEDATIENLIKLLKFQCDLNISDLKELETSSSPAEIAILIEKYVLSKCFELANLLWSFGIIDIW